MQRHTFLASLFVHFAIGGALFVHAATTPGTLPTLRSPMPAFVAVLAPPVPRAANDGPTRPSTSSTARPTSDAIPPVTPDTIADTRDPTRPATTDGPTAWDDPGRAESHGRGVGGIGDATSGIDIAPPVHRLPTSSAPRRVGRGVKAPARVVGVMPIYPELARRAGMSGHVVVDATIDEDGVVRNVRVIKSSPIFDDAAITAVRQWRYTPTLLDDVPTSVILTVTVTFSFN